MKPTPAEIDSGMSPQPQRHNTTGECEWNTGEDQHAVLQVVEHQEQQGHDQQQGDWNNDLQAFGSRLQLLELAPPSRPVARRDCAFLSSVRSPPQRRTPDRGLERWR